MDVLVFGPEVEGFECAIFDEPNVDKIPAGLAPKKKRFLDRLCQRFKKDKKCVDENGSVVTTSTADDSMWSSVNSITPSIASLACSEHEDMPSIQQQPLESGVELVLNIELVQDHEKSMECTDESSFHESASVTADSMWSSSSSIASSIASPEQDIPLITQRLLEKGLGIGDFEFVRDHVSKEVLWLNNKTAAEEENISHIKTGIWQVIELEDDGTMKAPFHVVTGVTMDDQVDTKKLRKAIFAGKVCKRRPKLSMAPTEIAENLAGFQSGTMAPICHSKSMKLYLEESIVKDAGEPHKINVGSGMFGQCLSLDLERFLKVAKANPEGFVLCSIRKAKRKQ